jgi:hypothetical protein
MDRPFRLRHLLLVLAFAVLDVIGHVVGPKLRYPDPSPVLAHPTLMKAVAGSLLVLAFSVAVFTFHRLEPRLPGRRGAGRGLRFGLAWAAIYLAGGPQMALLSGGSLSQELYTALVDASALLALLVVAGALADRRPPAPAEGRVRRAGPAGVVMAFAVAGLVLAEVLTPSPFAAGHGWIMALAAVMWAVALVGVYLAVRPALGAGGPMRRGGRAALALGASLIPAFAFVPVFTRVDPTAFLAHTAILVVSAAGGLLAAERCRRPQPAEEVPWEARTDG